MTNLKDEFIKQLDRTIAVERNRTTDITITEINSSLFDIMLKFNKGFEYTCKDELIKMLEEILEKLEIYDKLEWCDVPQQHFEENMINGTRVYSTSLAKQNLLLWRYEDSDLYYELSTDLEDISATFTNSEQKELYCVKSGVYALLEDTLEEFDVSMDDTVSKKVAKKMLDFLKD